MAHFGYGGFFALWGEKNKICLRIFYQARRIRSVFEGFCCPKKTPKFMWLFSFFVGKKKT
jgi:hypothetical protein